MLERKLETFYGILDQHVERGTPVDIDELLIQLTLDFISLAICLLRLWNIRKPPPTKDPHLDVSHWVPLAPPDIKWAGTAGTCPPPTYMIIVHWVATGSTAGPLH